jgi:cell division protease FtsH
VTYDPERHAFLPQSEGYVPMVRTYSEQSAWQIDEAVRELSERAFARATSILRLHQQLLDETAAKLLQKETLSADELPAVEPYEPAENDAGTEPAAKVCG